MGLIAAATPLLVLAQLTAAKHVSYFPGDYFDTHSRAALHKEVLEGWPGPTRLVELWSSDELEEDQQVLLLLGGYYGLTGAGLAHLAASLAQVSMAVVLSRLGFKGRFLAGVFTKAAVCGLISFGPILLVNAFFAGVPYGVAVKAALLLVALIVYRVMMRAVSVFTGEERGTLTEMLAKRGLGFLGKRLF